MSVGKLQQPTVVLAAEKNAWSLETDVLKSYSVYLGHLAHVIEPLGEENLTFLSVKRYLRGAERWLSG